jgi:hypothetical protein
MNRIGEGDFQKYEEMVPQLESEMKQEKFDRKEFSFGRTMLNMKMRESLRPPYTINY